jgi:two-component system nitrogen regulation sensor histidine kinase NtrY
VYLSFFLMLTLMILVGATWMGLYLAKRITRPVQMLAAAAARDRRGPLRAPRSSPRTGDEFGSLVEAFNRHGRRSGPRAGVRSSAPAVELEQKHRDVEGRRQYVETVLDRVATGVIAHRRRRPHPHAQLGGVAPAGAASHGGRRIGGGTPWRDPGTASRWRR